MSMHAATNIRIEILRPQTLTAEDAAQWTAFLAQSPELSGPYFDIRYVQAIGAHVPNAAVARFSEDGRVVGYFPYQIRSGALQPMGAPLTDYHGMVGEAGRMMDFGGLLKATGARRLEFQAWAGPMCEMARITSLRRRVADTSMGFEAWFAAQNQLHHKFFKNVGRCQRNVEKDFGGFAFTWERVTPEVLDWVLGLKRDQYRKTGLHDIFDCGWTRDMLRDLSEIDAGDYGLRAGVFRHDGKLVAAEISLMDKDSVHLWFPAYDPAYYRYTVGILLTFAIIRHCTPLGIRTFDFGTGGEDYKSPMTVEGGAVMEGNLKYSPRLGSRMLDLTAGVLPIGRQKFAAARLSLKRRVNIIRATEIGLAGWSRALYALGQRAVMRLRSAKV